MNPTDYRYAFSINETPDGYDIITDHLGDVRKHHVNVMLKSEEAMVRKKLIELGWTPPNSEVDMKFVHLNLSNGQFSDSWTGLKDTMEVVDDAKTRPELGDWRTIGYRCLSHPDFEFTRFMKIK